MIVRIVKLSLKPEMLDSFLQHFEAVRANIAAFEGCSHLELFYDLNNPSHLFTYSHWESESHLNAYLESALFRKIWTSVKPWFNGKPDAWSLVSDINEKNEPAPIELNR